MKKSEIFLLLTGIIFLMLVSEILYTINRRPEFMQFLYVELAKQAVALGKVQLSVDLLKDAAYKSEDTNAEKYTEYNPDKYQRINFDSASTLFKSDYKNYLNSIAPLSVSNDNTRKIANIFYNLGLIAYKDGEKDATKYFFRAAIFWDPLLTYYHVELANFYLSEGDNAESKSVLDFCSQIYVTSEYCTEFLKDNFQNNYSEKVGFLQERITSFVSN